MKRLIAIAIAGLGLAGCAGDPAWNYATFPPQPEYGMQSAPAPVADVKK